MLAGGNPQKHSQALACLIHFEFSLVRDLLFRFLLTAHEEPLFETGLCLFRTNPEPENLFLLYRLEKSLPEQFSKQLRAIRLEQENLLRDLGLLHGQTSTDLETRFAKQLLDLQKKEKAAVPAFSLRALQKPKEAGVLLQVLAGIVAERKLLAFGDAGVLLVMLLWSAFSPAPSTSDGARKGGPVLADPISITGTVENVDESFCEMKVIVGGNVFVLLLLKEDLGAFQNGDQIKAVVLPFKTNSQNWIFCRPTALEKL